MYSLNKLIRRDISKFLKLRKLLYSNETEFIMEAHNGVSAKIVEETGFKGIWGSGLSISASLGIRDSNEASWTQVIDVVEYMSDATRIPILLDGDTGYGNFNNAIRLVRKLEQINVGGVCLEDKTFPKSNSLLSDTTHTLADINEFSGKIKACKDSQKDSNFCVIARLESIIAGYPIEEALYRADCYIEAGADAILVHSKKQDSSDIKEFMKYYNNNIPIVIVPTKYYTTPTDEFKELGISLIIWANHNMRGSIKMMQKISKNIYNNESLIEVEKKIVPVTEVFRLQNQNELEKNEKKYLNYKTKTRPPIKKEINQTQIKGISEQIITDNIFTERIDYKINPKELLDIITENGTDFVAGVPDSLLKDFCSYVDDTLSNHIITANEGQALSIGAGHYLSTGTIPLIYLQNSGLGNIINPLQSLCDVFSIPVLLLIGWRGEPFKKDEPQHKTQGKSTLNMLNNLDIPNQILSTDINEVEIQLNEAYESMYNNLSPYAFVIRKNTFQLYNENIIQNESVNLPLRIDVIESLIQHIKGNDIIFTTTGFTSRELDYLRQTKKEYNGDFYVIGSMGYCSSIAFGVARIKKDRIIYCIDGDGSFLMHMGCLSTIGSFNLDNFVHIVIKNNVYESVGGQPITKNNDLSFSNISKECGYSHNYSVDCIEDFIEIIKRLNYDGSTFIEFNTRIGSIDNLPRPKKTPIKVKYDFMEFLT
jgi:phosphoenolpyruvate phosphomutase